MDNKDERALTAEELKASVNAGTAANVDDILGEIMDRDGMYSSGYEDMISKYGAIPGEAPPEPQPSAPRRSALGRTFPRRDYNAEADEAVAAQRRAEQRVNRKMAPSVRGTVAQEGQDLMRPEFTYDGSVRYPSYGIGESGERVIYDADWEDQAKQEASKISRTHGGEPIQPDRAQPSPFRFTGAEEPLKRKTAEAPLGAKERTYGVRRPSEEQEFTMDNNDFYNETSPLFRSGVPVGRADLQEPAAQPQEQPDARGLSPEAKRTVDNAVLEAFSSDFDSDAAFKERWKETVEKAQRRKELKAKQAQEEEARLRSQQKLEEQERRVAQMEKVLERTPPPPQHGAYAPIPELPADEPAQVTVQMPPEQPTVQMPPEQRTVTLRPGQPAVPQRQTPDSPFEERLDPYAEAVPMTDAENTVRKSKNEQQAFRKKTQKKNTRFSRFVHNNLPCPGDSGKQIVRKLIMDISFVAFVGALIYLAIYYVNYRTEIKTENENYSYIEQAKNVPAEDQPAAWEEIKAKYPDVEFPEGMNYAFAQVYALNQDTVGYLTIKETNAAGEEAFRIRTVLLQSKAENGDYYLKHNFYKKTSRYGHPYVKINCSMGPEGLSKNTIVYGHNTHDHLIFNRLEDYMTKDGYISAPVITLDTLYGTTKWKIFAVMLTNADPADDNGHLFEYLDSDYANETAFLNKMDQIKKRSMIHTGVDVQAGDKTLMLYTCYRTYFDSGRLVIVARQLREGESETINTSQVYECKNTAIFPAAYYTGSRKNIETTTEPTTRQPAAQPTQNAPSEPVQTDSTEPSDNGGAAEEPTQEPPISEFEPPASEPEEENTEPGEN